MREIIGFIKQYFQEVPKAILGFCTLFVGALIYLNYGHGLEDELVNSKHFFHPAFTGHLLLFLVAFLLPHGLLYARRKNHMATGQGGWSAGLLLAPVIFALKMSIDTGMNISGGPSWNSYWNDILYWPLRLLIVLAILIVTWYLFHRQQSFYGFTTKKFKATPYLIMLLIMVPLIAAASTQPDFLAAYPKMKHVLPLPDNAHPGWWYKLLFELSYGSDFFSIELFFRGFLVIGFARWVGKDAILPMACFYCTIHFGKPMGECISSYFGGLLLGIVSYHTRSVYGGLMVHLGIAWLMEAGGYIGNSLTQ